MSSDTETPAPGLLPAEDPVGVAVEAENEDDTNEENHH